jgi:acyl-CoA reductase-like NAD-dependent aldehyde dehydrogenase
VSLAPATVRLPRSVLIEGEAFEAASGATFEDFSPIDGRHLQDVAAGDGADVDRAVSEVGHAAGALRYDGEAIDKVYGEVAPTAPGELGLVTRVPIGVVGVVTPWNYPLMMPAWKLGPALASGSSVVLKPAEQSPATALRLAELGHAAGVPGSVLGVVPGLGPTAGAALGRHRDVDALSFTGSNQVGQRFLLYGGESNQKAISLECGGKSPHVVFADAPDRSYRPRRRGPIIASRAPGGLRPRVRW